MPRSLTLLGLEATRLKVPALWMMAALSKLPALEATRLKVLGVDSRHRLLLMGTLSRVPKHLMRATVG